MSALNVPSVIEILLAPDFDVKHGQSSQAKVQAFAELVRHFQGPLFGFLGRLGMNQAQAEDLAQDTFIRAWRHLPQFDPQRAQFSTWLFTIAKNLALNELSRANRQQELPTNPEHAEGLETESEAPGPEQALELAQRKALLNQALAQLAFDDRSALALAYVQGLELGAIASIENCSLAAIKTRLHRAKRKLRNILSHPISGETKEWKP